MCGSIKPWQWCTRRLRGQFSCPVDAQLIWPEDGILKGNPWTAQLSCPSDSIFLSRQPREPPFKQKENGRLPFTTACIVFFLLLFLSKNMLGTGMHWMGVFPLKRRANIAAKPRARAERPRKASPRHVDGDADETTVLQMKAYALFFLVARVVVLQGHCQNGRVKRSGEPQVGRFVFLSTSKTQARIEGTRNKKVGFSARF